ncbi:MAG: hypothetical protein LBG19_10730 [Prevotellaceae bacterium]|jgi:hypothetical protein|nr:hypothetical protein [Prevotellaceae bacterium]
MVGNNPRSYYIAAVFFALFAAFLGYQTWRYYRADEEGIKTAIFLFCAILCVVEVLLLIRNGKRRARGVPPKGKI